MIQLAPLRRIVRKLGLAGWAAPLVAWLEGRRLRALGSYSAWRDEGSGVVLEGFSRRLHLARLSEAQCLLALSPHERPTMTVVLGRLKPGQVAWDVGANIGFYTQMMSEAVGSTGRVFAFEPNAGTFAELSAHVAHCGNVTLVQKALGGQDGMARMVTPADYSSASRVVSAGDSSLDSHDIVQITKGDALVASGAVPQPQFLKIDVEGHELEVVRGLKSTLASPACQCVLVEVHFSLLDQAGHRNAPGEISRLLAEAGLKRQTWAGRSHLLAER